MNNLHILLTPCVNESRVLKIVHSLKQLGIVEHVSIAALHQVGLRENEQLGEGIKLKRFKLMTRSLPRNVLFQAIKVLEYFVRVVVSYWSSHIAVINVHSFELLPLGVILKYAYRAKLVYDTHELETEQDDQEGLRKKFSRWLERSFIGFVDDVFVVSEGIADEYVSMYGIRRPHVVMNCPRFQSNEKTNLFRDQFRIAEEVTIYLYLGGLAEGRGIEATLEAFERLNDPNRVIVFMGYGPLESLVMEATKRSPSILYAPAVPPHDVLKYASSADVGISFIENTCKSYYLCLPNKLFEFVMAGLPVIVSNMPEMSKFVRAQGIGVVASRIDADGMIEAIDSLDLMDRDELGRALAETAGWFNWESQERVLEKAYERLLSP